MKIVINDCHGGFGLSEQAIQMYETLSGEEVNYDGDIPRDDPHLITVVEQLKELVNDRYSELKIVEIPDGTNWEIQEYDGLEWIAEKHKTWR